MSNTQLDELRRIVKEVYTPFYANINDTVEEEIGTFAAKLFAKKVIGWAVMRTNDYRKIINEFQAGLTWMNSIKDIEDYCQNFIDSLAALGGPAVGAAKNLKKGWRDAVWERQSILFLRDQQQPREENDGTDGRSLEEPEMQTHTNDVHDIDRPDDPN